MTRLSAQTMNIPDGLDSGDDDARRQALLDLGIDKDTANAYSDFRASMAGGIGWYPQIHEHAVLLFLPCHGTWAATVVLLRPKNGQWRKVDEFAADCLYKDQVFVDFAPLMKRQSNVILLHYDCVSHGTGYVEHHLEFLTIEGDRLRKRFDVLEHEFAEAWNRKAEHEPGEEESHTYLPVHLETGVWVLEDTRERTPLIDENPQTQLRKVDRRVISWSGSQKRFIATKFRTIRVDN